MKITDSYLAEEAIVLSYIKCELQNHRLENQYVNYGSVSFEIEGEEDYRTIVISSPYFEIIQIQCNEADGTLYDYNVIRNEPLPY